MSADRSLQTVDDVGLRLRRAEADRLLSLLAIVIEPPPLMKVTDDSIVIKAELLAGLRQDGRQDRHMAFTSNLPEGSYSVGREVRRVLS
ncbi:MAG: hypothetical protein NWE89_00940, partial [Candidatus Bathyarchaeota archaeon]|nr:hypothetical protein [Candidatus Bathyarchaeota archaeon]